MKLTNYQSAIKRIIACTTKEQVYQVEAGIYRVYKAGLLKDVELCRLSDMAAERIGYLAQSN